jgi:hypothetical protein
MAPTAGQEPGAPPMANIQRAGQEPGAPRSDMNDFFSFLEELVGRILKLDPANLIIVGGIALGYVLRIIKKFPNDYIPLTCFLFTFFLYPLISFVPLQPVRKYAIDGTLAIIFWLSGWIAHRMILRPIEKKLFKNGIDSGDTATYIRQGTRADIGLEDPARPDPEPTKKE